MCICHVGSHQNRCVRLANARNSSKSSIAIILFWRLKKSKSKSLIDALSKNHESIVACSCDSNWANYSVAVVFFWKTFSWFRGYHGKSWSILDSSIIHTLRFGILGETMEKTIAWQSMKHGWIMEGDQWFVKLGRLKAQIFFIAECCSALIFTQDPFWVIYKRVEDLS